MLWKSDSQVCIRARSPQENILKIQFILQYAKSEDFSRVSVVGISPVCDWDMDVDRPVCVGASPRDLKVNF